MTGTVDVVIAGDGDAARTAVVDALQRGQRVLVALRSADPAAGRRLRRGLLRIANVHRGQLTVMTSAEIVCVDGVDGVEAVVLRHPTTGRLSAVNASAVVFVNH